MPPEDDPSEEDDREFQQQQRSVDQTLGSLTSEELVQLLTQVEAELKNR